MCLCGMLAAEYQTLPKPMRSAVVSFFDDQEAWLVGVLEQGREEGTLHFSGSASEAAQVIVGGLEGAMLVTRPYGDPARFQIAADHLLASFAAGTPASVR
jgi:TetR/AcrR family transcriptional repressor of nem operon